MSVCILTLAALAALTLVALGVGHSRRPLGCGIAGMCGQSCQLINVDAPPASDATRDPRYAAEVDRVGHGSNPMYVAAVPLITTRGTCSGVLQVPVSQCAAHVHTDMLQSAQCVWLHEADSLSGKFVTVL